MPIRILAAAMLAAGFALPAAAATQALLPAQPGDLVPAALQARPVAQAKTSAAAPTPRVHVERQPVQVSWALDPSAPLADAPQPYQRHSREYWTEVSASELQQGIELPLSAPGAVIRLSPGDAAGGRLQAAQLHLSLGGRRLDGAAAASRIADAGALKAAGMDVPEASLALQLKPELGTGQARLQADGASGRYLVHVFEPNSTQVLTAQADRSELLSGGSLHVRLAMQDGGRPRPLQAAGGYLLAPDGSTQNLSFGRDADGSYVAKVAPSRAAAVPGLWEVQGFTVAAGEHGEEVRRDATAVFAVAAPAARLGGAAEVQRGADGGIDIALDVDAVGASRYAVSGVLYGRAADGGVKPGAYAQSAAWLDAGHGRLRLHFTPASLRNIDGPYELRDLRLQDQPALGTLERRSLAMRLGL